MEAASAAAAANHDLPVIAIALCINRQNDGLRAKLARKLGDQRMMRNSGRVDRDLVCAGPHHGTPVFKRSNATARRERNGKLCRDTPNGRQESRTAVARSRNIEHHELVRAFLVVPRRKSHRIARITQPDKVHAPYHARPCGIQTRNDAMSEAHAADLKKLSSRREPASPLFSG